uniref:Uncharacterized protein n=1 Tax=Haplochromis burtoni TaxID=8153 RepID=A0A3Q2WPA6_HAPBU
MQIPGSSVQTFLHEYKLFRFVTTLPSPVRRPKLPPSDDRKSVRMLKNNPETTKAQTFLYHHELRGSQLKSAAAHMDKPKSFMFLCFLIPVCKY